MTDEPQAAKSGNPWASCGYHPGHDPLVVADAEVVGARVGGERQAVLNTG